MSKKVICSFCGNHYDQGQMVLFRSEVTEEVLICEECIGLCADALEEVKRRELLENPKQGMLAFNDFSEIKPSIMKKHFDDYIVNQENAKKILSVAVYNHYKRIQYNSQEIKDSNVELKKSNVLMVGPSGCGKTLFVETIAKKLGIPYSVADCTSLTQSGLNIA